MKEETNDSLPEQNSALGEDAPAPSAREPKSRVAQPHSRSVGKTFRRFAMAGAFVLCVAALVVGARLTWTAYTGNAYLKGVEVTNATQSLFASDMLAGYYSDPGESIDARSVVVESVDDDTCRFSFSIYNCLLDDRNVVNDKDVPYVLSVSASGIADSDWSISPAAGSVTLPGYTPTVETYTITLPKSALGQASFTVKAAVSSSDGASAGSIGTKLNCLAAKIVPNERSSVQAASVAGTLVDKTDSNSPAEYDAYNYRVTVTGIATKVKIVWEPSVVELDPYFKSKHVDAVIDAENGTATFTMQPGSTVVNFYRVSSVAPDSWDNLNVSAEKAE